MTYTPGTWTCDRCGEPVDEHHLISLVTTTGLKVREADCRPGWLGHFHLACWCEVVGAVADVFAPPPADTETAEDGPLEWRKLTIPAREHLVYQALDGKRLTIRQIVDTLKDMLPPQTGRDLDGRPYARDAVHDSEVRSVVGRLFRDRQLAREPERYAKTKTRYRYYVPPLCGPIADLEQALTADDASRAD